MKKIPHAAQYETISHWISSPYYVDAEQYVPLFWEEKSPFRFLFDMLDPTDIVELACGHGRHVPMYAGAASTITLVDPVEENIAFCKKRLSQSAFSNKISYITNSGNELAQIEDASRTSIFCYDAMVHFELIDIWMYLNETYRILKPGGCALFHHSNAAFQPGAKYSEKPHCRNFMSAELFSHIAVRANMIVSKQIIIPWGEINNLDCITLLWKNT